MNKPSASPFTRLPYGTLAVLTEWLYTSLPEAEKEPGLTWTVSHHIEMARVLDTKNYAVARAAVARLETHITSGHSPAQERRAMAKVS